MSTLQKIIVCALAALFILILMCGWGYFAYHGKTDVGVFEDHLFSFSLRGVFRWAAKRGVGRYRGISARGGSRPG